MADRLPTNLRDFRSEEQKFHHKDLPVTPKTLLESNISNHSAQLSEVLKKTRRTTQLSNYAFFYEFSSHRTNLIGVFGFPYCFALPAVLTICARFLRTSRKQQLHSYNGKGDFTVGMSRACHRSLHTVELRMSVRTTMGSTGCPKRIGLLITGFLQRLLTIPITRWYHTLYYITYITFEPG